MQHSKQQVAHITGKSVGLYVLLQELYTREYFLYAGLATGFTAAPHILMSMLLIVRQGWLQAASQACGFILTLNPFESLSPIPEGILGLFVISVGFIAYVLIAASGLWFEQQSSSLQRCLLQLPLSQLSLLLGWKQWLSVLHRLGTCQLFSLCSNSITSLPTCKFPRLHPAMVPFKYMLFSLLCTGHVLCSCLQP